MVQLWCKVELSGAKWVINMFMGQYDHTIDDKGRIIIPTKFRDNLGSGFVITRGLDCCLAIYPKEAWERIITEYQALPNTKDARSFMRFLISGASTQDIDKQGRINIPSALSMYAFLNKECSVIGVDDHVEIWNTSIWNKYLEDNEPNIADIADKLFTKSL